MKTYRILIVLLVVSSLFLLVACGGGKQTAPGKASSEDPDWFGLQSDPNWVFSYGTYTASTRNGATVGAQEQARLNAAMQVEVTVKGKTEMFFQEAGTQDPQVLSSVMQISKSLANAKFSGAMNGRLQVFEKGGKFTAYAQYMVPTNAVNKNMMDYIKNEEALYTEFKKSQAFADLDAELDRMGN